jgi:hypothetical protein
VKKGMLGSIAALVTGAGLAFGQSSPSAERGTVQPTVPPGATVPGKLALAGDSPADSGKHAPAIVTAPEADGMPMPGQPLWMPASVRQASTDDYDSAEYGPGPCPYRVWVNADFLLWWTKPGLPTAPLATTGPDQSLGIIGQPGVTVAIGNKETDYSDHIGGKVTAGFWLDKGGHVGIELSGFILEENNAKTSAASDPNGIPLLARSQINSLTGQESSSLVSLTGALSGNIDVTSSSQLWGAETNFIGSVFRGKHITADMIIGFRYLGLQEDLQINSSTNVISPVGVVAFNGSTVGAGNTLQIVDRFETTNHFYGGQIGGHVNFHAKKLFLDLEGKLGVGNTHESVTASGSTTLIGGGNSATLPGGIFAVGSNSSPVTRDEFTLVPQASAKFGMHITQHLTAFVGYDFLYWFDVARPAGQINRVVSPTQVPSNLAYGQTGGTAQPYIPFDRSDFWAQGLNFGLEFRY